MSLKDLITEAERQERRGELPRIDLGEWEEEPIRRWRDGDPVRIQERPAYGAGCLGALIAAPYHALRRMLRY